MSEKLCIFCKHFRFSEDTLAMGSSWTGPYGTKGGMSCEKKHYTKHLPADETEMRATLLIAECCSDYFPPPQD